MKILIEQEGQRIEMTEEELANYIKNHNCVKSKYLKCPLRDVCYDMVDDDDECNARLEDYNKGRADAIDECIKLFKEMQPRLATNVVEFGDMLEQLKENKNE